MVVMRREERGKERKEAKDKMSRSGGGGKGKKTEQRVANHDGRRWTRGEW